MQDRHVIFLALFIQAFCAGFFLFEIFATAIGIEGVQNSWRARQMVEIAAALGLMLGLGLGAYALRRTLDRRNHAEYQMMLATGEFSALLVDSFDQWGLTPAEHDVALFVIKGMSTKEIAHLRDTSEGTVKAQTNAIYRKANVSGRSQLVSHFIEDLMEGIVDQHLAQKAEQK